MQIAVLLYDQVTGLDAVGPCEVLSRMGGEELARANQCGIEYDPHPPYDARAPEKVEPAIVSRLLALKDIIF